ncbi:MAG TPA: rhodanese-like domain-containing protein [Flavisolibacter sp.]|nr:rhodanese-like domain-containing protein [Flavisolibacter sp.]
MNYFKRITTALIIIFLFNDPFSAQVQSKSFKVLLKTILSRDVPHITVPDAAKSFHKYLFLDARETEEYKVSRIQNAHFVGYKNFKLSNISAIDKKTMLVVYCSIGKRSEAITKKLREAGYTNVQNLYGGIIEWVNQEHPVYNSQSKRTDSVHAYDRFWGQWLDKGIKVY